MKDLEFRKVILIVIFSLLFLTQFVDSCSPPLNPETISEIETFGLDANCLDVIGKWSFEGSSIRWEFREDGWFRERQTNFINNVSGEYFCNEASRMLEIPQPDDYVGTYSYPVQLGKILDGHMTIYIGKEGRAEVIVRKAP